MARLPMRVIEGESVAKMRRMEAESVDMVFADPPYNLQLKGALLRPDASAVDGVKDSWDQFASFSAYDDFTKRWLEEAQRLLKPNGTLWVIGSYHNIFRIGTALQDLGFWILNDVIWRKSNPMPNFLGRRFTNAHETLIWASRDRKSSATFQYHALKTGNEDLQMRSDDWLLPLCTGHERLRGAGGKKLHATQKPEALLHRVILSSTHVGDMILDPFCGTGTTGAVARKLRRGFVGIEQDSLYATAARDRIARTRAYAAEDLEVMAPPSQEARIPFGTLVEHRIITPGSFLYSSLKRHRARVRADGSLISGGETGSIHRLGARLQEKDACNGWMFWHIQKRKTLVPIDALRQQFRTAIKA